MQTFGKLRGAIIENYGTQYAFAEALGITRSTLTLKMKGENPWTQPEMKKSCELLNIPISKVHSYFF